MPSSNLDLPIEDEDEMRTALLKQRETAMRERVRRKERRRE